MLAYFEIQALFADPTSSIISHHLPFKLWEVIHVRVFMSADLNVQCPWISQNRPGLIVLCCGVNHPANLSGLKQLNTISCSCYTLILHHVVLLLGSGGLPIVRRKAKENIKMHTLALKVLPRSDTSPQSHVIGQSRSFGHIRLGGVWEGQFCHVLGNAPNTVVSPCPRSCFPSFQLPTVKHHLKILNGKFQK